MRALLTEARIKEFEEMIALKREAGDTPLSIGRMQAERDAVVASRDEMTRRLQGCWPTQRSVAR